MAFVLTGYDKLSAAGNENVRHIHAYTSADDSLATIKASAYFNSIDHYLNIGDDILIDGSDGFDRLRVTAVSPNVTTTTEPDVAPDSISNAEIASDAGIEFSKLEDLTDGELIVGSGANVPTAVALSGDATIDNAGALTIAAGAIDNAKVDASAAIAFSKLAALTDAQFLVGNGSNVAVDVAMSGDASLANTGAVTLGTVVDASKAADYAPEDVVAGMPVLHVFNMVASATATRSIVTSQKITVVDAWAVAKGAGSASDTVQLQNDADADITDALDMNVSDTVLVRAGEINDANRVVNAGDELKCTVTDGGGGDVPAIDVYVLCYVTA